MSSRWPFLLALVLAPLVFVARPLAQGHVLGDIDGAGQSAPWNRGSTRPFDVLQADAALQFYPWRDLVFEAWRNGEAPAWNPYELCGTPLLANSQSGALYPPHVVMSFFPASTAVKMTLLAWLHLALAGLGVYALARQLGAERAPACFGGIAFGASAFLTAWLALPSVVSTVAWMPWALWGVALGFSAGETPSRWAKGWVPILAGSVALMVFAGHLQFVAYGLMAVVLFGASLAIGQRRGWRGLQAVAAAALGIAIALPQLLPVLNYSRESHRRNVPTEAGYQAYVAGAIQPFEFLGVALPQVYGDPARFHDPEIGPVSRYWPAFVKRGANFAESALGLGPALLAGLAFVRRRTLAGAGWAVAAVGALALLLACGTPLNRLLYFYAPGWSSTGSPARVGVLFVLAASVLAALALSGPACEKPAKPLAIGGGVVAAVWMLALAAPAPASWIPNFDPSAVAAIKAGAVQGALAPVALALLAASLPLVTKGRVAAPVALGVAALLASVGFMWPLRSGAPLAKVDGPEPGVRIAMQNDAWELLVAARAAMPPNTATVSRIREAGGYDSLVHRESVQMLARANGGDPAPPANGNMMFVKPGADLGALAELGVTELWVRGERATPEQAAVGKPGPGGIVRVPVTGPGLVSTDRGPARVIEQTLTTMVIEVAGPTRLTVRERAMEGWSAQIDGQLAALIQAPWLVVDVPAGRRVVRFDYSPPGLRTGLLLAFGSIAAAWVASFGLTSLRTRLARP